MTIRTQWVAALSVTLLATAAQAQVLGGITASATSIKVGEPVTITANIDVINANYCGFVVGFGDGATKDGVSDITNPVPLVLTHSYAKAGTYHVTLGGRNVQNHPNCAGQEKAVDITVAEAAKPAVAAKSMPLKATEVCAAPWKLLAKTFNAKTGAYSCSAKPGTEMPATKPACSGKLKSFEDTKKGQFGCRA
jgi:hypothetical protein